MTKNDVVTRFRRRYPSCSETFAGSLFDEAYKRLMLNCPLRHTSYVVSLVDGQREYDLPTDVVRVDEAYYVESATSMFPLVETSKAGLVVKQTGWRMFTAHNRPFRYYVDSVVSGSGSKFVLGFEYMPDVTTSGGYPNVTVYYNSHTALTGTDLVPPQLPDPDVFLHWMYYKWCVENDAQNAPYWMEMSGLSLAQATDAVNNVLTQNAETTFFQTAFNTYTRVR